jgi:hypothetical protein
LPCWSNHVRTVAETPGNATLSSVASYRLLSNRKHLKTEFVVVPDFKDAKHHKERELVNRGISDLNFNLHVGRWISFKINALLIADLGNILHVETIVCLEATFKIFACEREYT